MVNLFPGVIQCTYIRKCVWLHNLNYDELYLIVSIMPYLPLTVFN